MDMDVDITDFNSLATNFAPTGPVVAKVSWAAICGLETLAKSEFGVFWESSYATKRVGSSSGKRFSRSSSKEP